MKYIEFDGTRKLDVVLIGRITIDFNPQDYYKPLSESNNFRKYVGGSPANIAVGLARLGKKCGFFARVSDDQFGEYVTAYLKNEGIDISHIKKCEHGEKTGLAFTEILSETNSSILMYREHIADLSLTTNDIDEEYIKSAKALLISGTALAASPSREAVIKAIALAKKNDTKIIFDIDFRNYNWKSEEEISLYYSLAAEQADIILGSREEYDLTERFTGLDGTDEKSAAYWTNKQASIIIIKHGKEGSAAYTNDGEKYTIKPFPVNALKSFGGGDGYGSSFINGLLEEWDLIACLEHGSASASMLVSSHSCSADMPTIEELESFIKRKKEQYGDMIARK